MKAWARINRGITPVTVKGWRSAAKKACRVKLSSGRTHHTKLDRISFLPPSRVTTTYIYPLADIFNHQELLRKSWPENTAFRNIAEVVEAVVSEGLQHGKTLFKVGYATNPSTRYGTKDGWTNLAVVAYTPNVFTAKVLEESLIYLMRLKHPQLAANAENDYGGTSLQYSAHHFIYVAMK